MSLHKTYRFLIMMLVGLFLAMQSFSIAHAAAYGDNPHEHDGITCSVTVLSAHHAVPLPDCPELDFVSIPEPIAFVSVYVSAPYVSPQGRAPPPRAPPFSL